MSQNVVTVPLCPVFEEQWRFLPRASVTRGTVAKPRAPALIPEGFRYCRDVSQNWVKCIRYWHLESDQFALRFADDALPLVFLTAGNFTASTGFASATTGVASTGFGTERLTL